MIEALCRSDGRSETQKRGSVTLSTGCLAESYRPTPPRSTIYGYIRVWTEAGVWAHVHDLLPRSRALEGRDESAESRAIEDAACEAMARACETRAATTEGMTAQLGLALSVFGYVSRVITHPL
jgi:hypothetical protein